MLTGKSDAIRTFVAALTVPFTPISTDAAHLAVPGATVLCDIVPAKRIPVCPSAFLACIGPQKLFQWDHLTSAGQFVLLRQLLFGESFVLVDVPDGADGKGLHIYVVQRVTALAACTGFVTGLTVFKTGAAPVGAT
jgi:hypothetical protein